MGGFFSIPKAPPAAPAPAAADSAATAADDTAARLDILRRARRGRPGLIKTGPRGFLTTPNQAPRRKSLLGE